MREMKYDDSISFLFVLGGLVRKEVKKCRIYLNYLGRRSCSSTELAKVADFEQQIKCWINQRGGGQRKEN